MKVNEQISVYWRFFIEGIITFYMRIRQLYDNGVGSIFNRKKRVTVTLQRKRSTFFNDLSDGKYLGVLYQSKILTLSKGKNYFFS